ncbi:hypothetical protein [Thalassomonas haliotis]|uniref:Uncharacterized protein n=1 Tax=Thalassomonas haliotis TaxID=485448 RepID=A0ABY7VD18_9GAMM|nr:hypothetical protein [Thalassomonas haliotis]WDE10870.1 hypothetical protein H3N35_21885 [Thalassomonas haliotis]
MDYDEIFQKYLLTDKWEDKNAAYKEQLRLIKQITTQFPKDKAENLSWFIASLRENQKKWFVAKVLDKVNPFPHSLFQDTLLAALVEENPSAIRLYLYPCVRQFGVEAVVKEIQRLSVLPEVIKHDGVSKVSYALEFCNV